mmetsp:Transcript_41104/g.113278  ORF Transcript_41104/g.113278 Transcript_41104/m.113278 type:complete len:278 (+) Transcript_41104:401-1234(+)
MKNKRMASWRALVVCIPSGPPDAMSSSRLMDNVCTCSLMADKSNPTGAPDNSPCMPKYWPGYMTIWSPDSNASCMSLDNRLASSVRMRHVPDSMMYKRRVGCPLVAIMAPIGQTSVLSISPMRTFCSASSSLRSGMLLNTCVRATARIFSSWACPIVEIKSSRVIDRIVTSVAARTDTRAGMSCMSAISPKNAPFLSWAMKISRPCFVWSPFGVLYLSQTPRSIMYNLSFISPSVSMLWPEENFVGCSFPTSLYCSSFVNTLLEKKGTLARLCCFSC